MEVLGGRAPVTVNGQRIPHKNAHGPLRKEDVVAIGAYRLRVLADAPAVDEQTATRRGLLARLSTGASNNAPERRDVANNAPAARHEPKVAAASPAAAPAKASTVDSVMLGWRVKVHASLVRQMDLRRVDVRGMKDEELRLKTAELIEDIIAREF